VKNEFKTFLNVKLAQKVNVVMRYMGVCKVQTVSGQ